MVETREVGLGMKSGGDNKPGGMSGSAPGSQLGASSFFVLTLDIPFNIVFHAADPLCSTVVDGVVPINSPASRSPSTHAQRRRVDDCTVTHRTRRDVISRHHTPEVVRRMEEERRGGKTALSRRITAQDNSRARAGFTVPVGRHEILSRPRSRSVCGGKYCSVNGLRASDTSYTPVCWSARRPRSATVARHLPSVNSSGSPRHHRPTARLHTTRPPVYNDVTVDDDDDTADSGVTSSVITSRDTSPWSDRSAAGKWRVMQSMTESDRQSQLRRFLDAVTDTSSSDTHQQQQQQAPAAHNDVTNDDDDDDDDGVTERELCEWQNCDHNDEQTESAMDQVRHLVDRCRLHVHSSTQPSVDALQRLDTWKRTIHHQSATTSEFIEKAILGAAADLVRCTSVYVIQLYRVQCCTIRNRTHFTVCNPYIYDDIER